MSTFSDQLRTIIETGPVSRYRLARLTGVSEAALSRFMARKTALTTDALDKLAPALGLKIISTKTRKRKGR